MDSETCEREASSAEVGGEARRAMSEFIRGTEWGLEFIIQVAKTKEDEGASREDILNAALATLKTMRADYDTQASD